MRTYIIVLDRQARRDRRFAELNEIVLNQGVEILESMRGFLLTVRVTREQAAALIQRLDFCIVEPEAALNIHI